MTDAPKGEDENAHGNKVIRGLLIGLAVIGAVLLVMGLWAFVSPSDPTEKKDFIQAVGILLAALVGLIGLFFTWRNQRLTQRSLEDAQRSTQSQLRLAEQGQITERFTRAIDQLGATNSDGSKSLEIRLGGVYALERIAKESEEYYWPIIEILTAYVREHGVWKPDEQEVITEWKSIPLRDAVIEAILGVLWKRSRHFGDGEPDRIVLPRTDLRATDFREANFDEAIFWQANLEGASFIQASLKRASFKGAILAGANLAGANLVEADLWEANLERADLRGADLRKTNLMSANLGNANLAGANLERAFLEVSNLAQSNLANANLTRAHLKRATLTQALLIEANLEGADLRNTNLSKARLERANLAGSGPEMAYFKDANLEEANLKGAFLNRARDLYQWQIDKAYGDEKTQLPGHLKPPAHWGVKPDEQIEED